MTFEINGIRLLCHAIISIYTKYDEICAIYSTDNVFGYDAAVKHHFMNLDFFSEQNWLTVDVQTFEINGHGASVSSHYCDIHII